MQRGESHGRAPSMSSKVQSGVMDACARQVYWITFCTLLACWHAEGALQRTVPSDAGRQLVHQHDSWSKARLERIPAQHRSAQMRHGLRTILQVPLPGGGFQAKKYFTYVFFGADFWTLGLLHIAAGRCSPGSRLTGAGRCPNAGGVGGTLHCLFGKRGGGWNIYGTQRF